MQAMRSWRDAVETSAAVWTTLGARLPMLATGGMATAEGSRMVTEKCEAATKGALEAGAVAARFAATAMLGAPSARAMAKAGIAMADAAMRPGRRTVKANARRLSKTKRS